MCLIVVVCSTCTNRTLIRVPSGPYTWFALRIYKPPSVTRREVAGVLDPCLERDSKSRRHEAFQELFDGDA
jgi:hypothetical protein